MKNSFHNIRYPKSFAKEYAEWFLGFDWKELFLLIVSPAAYVIIFPCAFVYYGIKDIIQNKRKEREALK